MTESLPTTDSDLVAGEVRQVNARFSAEIYQVLRFLSSRYEMSVGKLTEKVMTEYAITYLAEAREEARAAVWAAQRTAEALEQFRFDTSEPRDQNA